MMNTKINKWNSWSLLEDLEKHKYKSSMGCAPRAPGTYSASQISSSGATTLSVVANQPGPINLIKCPDNQICPILKTGLRFCRNFKWNYFWGYLIQIKETRTSYGSFKLRIWIYWLSLHFIAALIITTLSLQIYGIFI